MAKKSSRSAKGPSEPQDANYDFAKQDVPVKRFGSGSFANLPEKPMMRPYGFTHKDGYRDGLPNDFTVDLDDVSGICENHK